MQSSRIAPMAMRSLSASARRVVSRHATTFAHQASRNLHVQVPSAMYIRSDRLRFVVYFICVFF